jgi:transcriptional regulator with XRE-family HTH domain
MSKEDLRNFRETKGFSQPELAEYLGVKRQPTISDWETGKKPIPKWVELRIKSELKK